MDFHGEIVFSIKNNKEFQTDFTKLIGLNPTKVINRGHKVTSFLTAEYYLWLYRIDFQDHCSFNKNLLFLCQMLRGKNKAVESALNNYISTTINIYIRSEYAQIGFSIPKEVTNYINELGLDIDIHILSFGLVE